MSDSSAKYNIYARTVQQPPSEGMAKLTALLHRQWNQLKSKVSV